MELPHDSPAVTKAEKKLARKLIPALRTIGKAVAADVAKHTRLGKAEEEEDEADHAIARADWRPIAEATETQLRLVGHEGAKQALTLIGVTDEGITEQTFTSATEWAKARAAELVGKSWDGDDLVDNPDADMAITDTLRGEIRDAVAQAIEDGDAAADLADAIEGLGTFSEARATMIARTEIIRGHAQGQMTAMRSSGVVERKAWSTSGDDDVDEECEANEGEGDVGIDDDFQSGDDAPPAHPNCRCAVVAFISEEPADDDQDDEDEEDEEDE